MTLESAQSSGAYRAIDARLRKKTARRRAVRYSIISLNVLILLAVAGVVTFGTHGSGSYATANAIQAGDSDEKELTNPLDQVSSADIAVNIAKATALPEATPIVNQADSVSTELALTPASTSIVAKPQVVTTALKSKKDIKTYVAVAGDTVTTIATKFGVTSDSIRWSNNLPGNTVTLGQTLYIPPDNGIVYVVAAGDTPDSLATKFHASKDEITVTNDAELAGLKAGERIFIPNGSIQAAPAPVRAASYSWGAPVYGFNGYDYGYCTWYVANRVTVPANWGNANTWDTRAALSGWVVSKVPRVGAVAQSNRGSEGHVAYVEAVSPDGTQIKYSDMNGLAGWGRIGYSDWTSASYFDWYIYR